MVGPGCGKDGTMSNRRVKYKASSTRVSIILWRLMFVMPTIDPLRPVFGYVIFQYKVVEGRGRTLPLSRLPPLSLQPNWEASAAALCE